MTTDILILGAGTAGSVLTRRLLDAGLRVTLVEAGGMDTNPAVHDLSRVGELWGGPENWGWSSTPQAHAQGRRIMSPRGKVVGGSGQLNGTIWVRGTAWDYDGWAEAGNKGWAWDEVSPVFDRIETNLETGEGFMDRVTPDLSPIQQAIIDSAVATGLPLVEDYNTGDQDGVSRMQLNLRDGKRLSTWAAYVRDVLDHPNLTLLTGALVDRVVVTDGRATGAVVVIDGERRTIEADRIVLAAGALASPGVLLRSGIGPAKDLEALGIPVLADLPGVGANLQDHWLVPVIFGTEKREIDPPQPFWPVTQTHWFWKSDPALPVPDTQPINFSIPFYYDPEMTGPPSGFTLHAALIRPRSTGTVSIASTDPEVEPLIDYGVLSDPRDVAALVASVRQVRRVAATGPLAEEWGAHEVQPGPGTDDSDEAIEAWVRRSVQTYHHQVGTCRMGTDADAVVSPDLAVVGVEGLMVADASVMPAVTTGNTNAPTAMIAERAADIILGR
ncbi:GMC family oxidoreductase [Nocardioides sp. NPDC101246]|uniref:GMC family oxidoreductase n=1 Tax=Nocardioides sp. NPDC101246 TaxID=3364336 RepID=UPI0037FEC05B